MTCTSFADPITTGLSVGLSSSLLEDFLDGGPSSRRSTGHLKKGAERREDKNEHNNRFDYLPLNSVGVEEAEEDKG